MLPLVSQDKLKTDRSGYTLKISGQPYFQYNLIFTLWGSLVLR